MPPHLAREVGGLCLVRHSLSSPKASPAFKGWVEESHREHGFTGVDPHGLYSHGSLDEGPGLGSILNSMTVSAECRGHMPSLIAVSMSIHLSASVGRCPK